MGNRSRTGSFIVLKTVLPTATSSLAVSTFLSSFKGRQKNLKLPVPQRFRVVLSRVVLSDSQKSETTWYTGSFKVSTFPLYYVKRGSLKTPPYVGGSPTPFEER